MNIRQAIGGEKTDQNRETQSFLSKETTTSAVANVSENPTEETVTMIQESDSMRSRSELNLGKVQSEELYPESPGGKLTLADVGPDAFFGSPGDLKNSPASSLPKLELADAQCGPGMHMTDAAICVKERGYDQKKAYFTDGYHRDGSRRWTGVRVGSPCGGEFGAREKEQDNPGIKFVWTQAGCLAVRN